MLHCLFFTFVTMAASESEEKGMLTCETFATDTAFITETLGVPLIEPQPLNATTFEWDIDTEMVTSFILNVTTSADGREFQDVTLKGLSKWKALRQICTEQQSPTNHFRPVSCGSLKSKVIMKKNVAILRSKCAAWQYCATKFGCAKQIVFGCAVN